MFSVWKQTVVSSVTFNANADWLQKHYLQATNYVEVVTIFGDQNTYFSFIYNALFSKIKAHIAEE